ncbi:MAG: carboxylesterase family protein [Acidaminococcus sp.]|jgi:para-nitrobenzyl esterase|nr:carboxylesterase family protein [Acidaminococcus sp.]MCI2100988.1 carboxylesterase family protein [Acidaminococcus sp.]MCI2115367.1 carboxylesterase family protein [Acidaminococcus sp.]MCI2117463.1 carboxylesterase family protein [Acidaminococcus sp.]
MKQKKLAAWVLAALLAVPSFALAAPKQSGADMQKAAAAQKQMLQQGQRFLAGPGIAVAKTQSGQVQGFIRDGIYHYYGIPYAEADKRFQRAKPVKSWQGIRMAVKYGTISPQASGNFPNGDWGEPGRSFTMDNNCQNLNIWTPGLGSGAKRPVMVWLHGGGFEAGSSLESPAYDGENLSRRGDVVVVSVNHRLNLLGHLNLEAYGDEYKDSANVGITDLVDALKWVKDNIASFGGDPDNVTIFGESGGGAKVLTLMSAPEAKGLFNRGIVESGAVETMGPYVMTKAQSERVTELMLQNLGITKSNLDKLQTLPYETLMAAGNKALKQAGAEFKVPQALGTGYGMSWEPVVDGSFLPTHPVTEDSFAAAGRDVPLLIGTNLTEWTGFQDIVNLEKAQYDNENTWTDAEIDAKLKEKYGDKADAVVSEFLKAYPDKQKKDALYIDTMIRQPILKIMRHKAAQGGAPVYAYLFSWASPVMNGVYKSYHTAEIPFVFHNIDKMESRIGGSKEAETLSDRMSDAWISFARTGVPAVQGAPKWTSYGKDGGATMIFDNKIRLVKDHDAKLLQLLDPEYKYF